MTSPSPAPASPPPSAGAAEPPAGGGEPCPERLHRPWGWFETLAAAGPADAEGARIGYLVKRLWIEPGRRISRQRHRQRCEHWVVVAGSGLLECAEAQLAAGSGTTLEIPVGAVHRASAGPEGLLIIEVQRGERLCEDDIERFADDYGRVIGSGDNL